MAPLDVKTSLTYNVDDGVPRFQHAKKMDRKEEELSSGTKKVKEVVIRDARDADLDFDLAGFQLVHHPLPMKTEDFYDNEKVRKVYYPQIADMIKRATGAERVDIFHHQVRNVAKKTGGNDVGDNTKIQGYAPVIHTDTSEEAANRAFAFMASSLPGRYSKGRFLYCNAWRSIDGDNPIYDNSLAMLDAASVRPGDALPLDFFSFNPNMKREVKVLQYRLNERSSDAHRWYYFSQMTKDEALLFKQWDSDPARPARSTFHTAFKDPAASPSAPSRQSIEVRAMAYFPDHAPNTCPTGKVYIVWATMKAKKLGLVAAVGAVAAAAAAAVYWWMYRS